MPVTGIRGRIRGRVTTVSRFNARPQFLGPTEKLFFQLILFSGVSYLRTAVAVWRMLRYCINQSQVVAATGAMVASVPVTGTGDSMPRMPVTGT